MMDQHFTVQRMMLTENFCVNPLQVCGILLLWCCFKRMETDSLRLIFQTVFYFNRINFREIKFRGFANFRHFRENKTREIVWDSLFAKLNPREIFEIAFSAEKQVKDLHLLQKIAIFTWILGPFAK